MQEWEGRRPEPGKVIINNATQDDMWQRIETGKPTKGDRIIVCAANKADVAAWISTQPDVRPWHVLVVSRLTDLNALRGTDSAHFPRVYLDGFFDKAGLRAREIHHALKRQDTRSPKESLPANRQLRRSTEGRYFQ